MFITFADLAKLKGVSRSAVSQRRQSGILDGAIVKVGAREKLNKDLALELWDKNTAPVLNQLPAQTKKELKKQIDALPDDEIPDFNTSRARKEHWQASLAQLQVQQQKKDLIPVTQIKKSSFEMGRAIRESLANLADRLASQIAGETDPQVIHKLLTQEHRAALEQLVEQ
jgi:transcriptional regulator with XRE-family HTH domain